MSKFLIIGLGNVGNEYAHTRHNIGFDILYAFVKKHQANFSVGRLAYFAEVKWKGKQVTCICPTTFMNLSGKAVQYWMNKTGVALENTLTILDDLSLPLEKVRLRKTGTHAGHNGLKDIQNMLGTSDYPKLRFGIGNQYPKGMQADFVLGKWQKNEEKTVKLKIEICIEIIESFLSEGIDIAMSKFNNTIISDS